jgi:SAM-dependent methyltransferase
MSTTKCNLCSGEINIYFPNVLDPQTYENFSIYKCAECGLGHTLPQPEDLNPYYGPTYHGGRHSFTSSFCASRRVSILNKVTGTEKNRLLLDIGCGDGTFLLAAKEKGWKVVGTEINSSVARKAGLDIYGSIDEIEGIGSFDCITLWHSLEHLRDPKSTIDNLSKILKPNGALIIAVPDWGGFQAKIFKKYWVHLDVPRHLYHFNSRSLEYLTKHVEMKIENKWNQEFEYDLLGWVQSILNIILPIPNIFLYSLTGQQTKSTKPLKIVSSICGMFLSITTIPLVIISTLLHQGGTVIISARKIA